MMVLPTADPTLDGAATTHLAERQWFGHPRQLARLFTTEAMERFGYYGMRAILTLYLVQHFSFGDSTANGLYGAFTSLVYLTPLVGGLVADRLIGAKRSVKLGAVLMSLGYLTLCFSGEDARPYAVIDSHKVAVETVKHGEDRTQFVVQAGERLQIKGRDDKSVDLVRADGQVARHLAAAEFQPGADRSSLFIALMLLGLSAVTIGNGFFKPNISTIVGTLYAADDRRRDAGFTIFYMGINIGSIASQFLCPILAATIGWWAGFLFAACGMVIAFLLFQFDRGVLTDYGNAPTPGGEGKTTLIAVLAVIAIPLVWLLFQNTLGAAEAAQAAAATGGGFVGYFLGLPVLGQILFVTFVVFVIGIPVWASRAGNRTEFHMMSVAIVLIVFNVVFWTLFEQAGSSLTLFAERNTDRVTLIGTMPAGSAQVFNPVFVVLLAPVYSVMWGWLARRNLEPGIPVKFAFALMLVGAGYLALVFGTRFHDADFRVGLYWIALLYLLHSMGELAISPVGLSMITKLSIARVVGFMMGGWFLSIAFGQYMAGVVAQSASVETVGGQVTNLRVSLETYAHVYQQIGLASIGVGVVLLVLSPLIKRWMHGVT